MSADNSGTVGFVVTLVVILALLILIKTVQRSHRRRAEAMHAINTACAGGTGLDYEVVYEVDNKTQACGPVPESAENLSTKQQRSQDLSAAEFVIT